MSLAEPPYNATFYNSLKRVGDVWLKWFELLKRATNLAPQTVAGVSLSGQSASIGATSIATATLASGRYRFSFYARVTQAATTNSSLTVTCRSVESALTIDQTSPAMTGNTTTTAMSGAFIAVIDAGSALKYATTYSSTGGTVMKYRLSLLVEALPEAL